VAQRPIQKGEGSEAGLMNLPVFPTDNLYKFIAIAGLVLSGYSVAFLYQQVWELRLQIAQTELDEDASEIQFELLKKEVDTYIKLESIDLNKDDIKHIVARMRDLMTQKAKVGSKKIENSVLRARLERYYGLFRYSFFAGIGTSLIGFIAWYFRVQLPAERFMAARMKEINRDRYQESPHEHK
jgi:hypothetical protein